MSYNLGEMLAHRADIAPHHDGFLDAQCRLSYAEVNARCDTIAAWLKSHNLQPGDRVAILGKNSVAQATMIYGAAKADTISVMVNWRLQVQELAYILNDSGATVLFYDEAFAEQVAELRACTEVNLFICNGTSASDTIFADIISSKGLSPCPPAQCRGDDAAILMYTSGTTGKPKGAILTHNNFLAAAHGTSNTIDWLDSHRFLLGVPAFHIGGLMPLTTSVQKGTAVYFLPDFDPVEVWVIIARERITTTMVVPAMAQALLAVAEKITVDASSLISITCGASVVPQSIIANFAKLGVSVQQVYGLTEVTGATTFWKASMNPDKAGSHGKPVYLMELMIADPTTGASLATGGRGEIMCRSSVVFAGYWNNEAATAAAFREGWFGTGDVGYFDEDGFLYVVDRLKDLIISGGENIYPAEVEQILIGLEAVAEVAVVGQADDKWGEVPVAFIVLKPDMTLDSYNVFAYCKTQLATFKCPKRTVFITALPRNGVGKVLKNTLREQL